MPPSLVAERDRFVAFAFAANDVLVETDAAGRVRYAAGALAGLWPDGVDPGDLEGREIASAFREPDRALLAVFMEEIKAGGRRGPVVVTSAHDGSLAECSLLRTPGTPSCHFTLRRLHTGHAPAGAAAADPQTGLLDGAALGDCAEREFLRLVDGDSNLELSLVRLVGLERVPGGLHGARGRALIARLAASLRAVAIGGGAAARLGDDRFALVHAGEGEAERLNRLLHAQLAADGLGEIRVERRDVALADPQLTPSQACAALRHAIDHFAAHGRADFDQLADALGRKVADTAARVADAKAVIDSRAFYVFYQPIVGLADGRVHHHEALARLRDRARDIFDFVTFAETVGFIADFDLAVVREVFDKLAQLRRRRHRPSIAVNLSARSLTNEAFVERLLALGRSAGDNARQVLFEVTESFQLTDLEHANAVIQRLRAAGHAICLDDFGAGAAAFHYIRALEVDYVKLDGAFVQRVLASERDRAVLAGMIELCRSLGVATVAEMVETDAQAADLARLGVDYAQGFLFGAAAAEPLDRPTRR